MASVLLRNFLFQAAYLVNQFTSFIKHIYLWGNFRSVRTMAAGQDSVFFLQFLDLALVVSWDNLSEG